MIGSLLEKGLIVRDTLPGNRKQAQVALTPAGHALFEELMPQVQEINRQVLKVLSDAEMAQLDDFIRRLHISSEALRQELDAQLPRTQRRLGQRRS